MISLLKAKKSLVFFIFLFICFSVEGQNSNPQKQKLMEKVRETEKQFENDLNKIGVDYAFEKYAAPNAVIQRKNDSLIFGLKGIKEFYSNNSYKKAKAVWTPDYIDVSDDGTMAYTFGKYQWTMLDKTGKEQKFTGVFHTVWKKQSDGKWKYVWD